MKTLNQVLDIFKNLATNHYQINSSFVGQTYDFQAQENLYPSMVIITQPSNIQRGRILYNFDMYLVDLLNKDISNQNEIESDMFQVIVDFVAELKDNEDEYGFTLVDEDILVEPVKDESMDDIVAGQKVSLTIEAKYDGSICNTAFKN